MAMLERSKSNTWFSSAFEDLKVDTSMTRTGVGKKRNRTEEQQSHLPTPKRTSLSFNNEELWLNRHEPVNADQLAVQPKKVEEVRDWMLNHLHGGVLLLNGPPGAGKTAVIKQIASEFQLKIEEWTTSVVHSDFNEVSRSIFERRNFEDRAEYVSQPQQFSDWLRNSKFQQGGFGNETSKLILIEDFPPFACRSPDQFQDILLGYSRIRRKPPLVLISSDEGGGAQSTANIIFKPDFINKAGIDVISFNAATTTNLVKMLTRIASEESRKGEIKFKVPDKAALEMLVESSGGDIRASIHCLQFSCLNGINDFHLIFQNLTGDCSSTSSKKKSKESKKRQPKSGAAADGKSSVGSADKNLDLFHALGKILYAKRSDEREKETLPSYLGHHKRNSLISNPEQVFEKAPISEDGFTCFLHENYPAHFSDLNDVAKLSSYLSESDLLLQEWGSMGKMDVREYGVSIAARAVMFTNQKPAKVSGLRKMSKPHMYSVKRTIKDNLSRIGTALRAEDMSRSRAELFTSTIPLLAHLKLGSSHSANIIQDIGRISGVSRISCSQASNPSGQQIGNTDEEMFSGDDELFNDIFPAESSTKQGDGKEKREKEEDYDIEDFDD